MNKDDLSLTAHERDLLRYVDDRLDAVQRARVEAGLRDDPDGRARVDAWLAQRQSLAAHFGPLADAPVPPHLLRGASGAAKSALLGRAAAAAWLAIGLAGGYLAATLTQRGEHQPSTLALVQEAAVAHAVYVPEVRHPVEVAAADEAHLVAWLSKRLGAPLRVPSLTAEGFSLVGGRLLPASAGPSAQFMYQDAQGQRLTLYVRTAPGEARDTAFRFAQEGRTGVFYWMDHRMGYALSGEIEHDRLMRVARAVYAQLDP